MSIVKSRHSLSGVRLSHHKNTEATDTVWLSDPAKAIIPMSQHMGVPCEPLVKKGDAVFVGQKIGDSGEYFSVPVHASCSGTVTDIIDYRMSSGELCKAVVIETDGKDTVDPSLHAPEIGSREDFLRCVRESGLVGLGGAGFPTHVKLAYKDIDRVKTLVVNAAECEPYITSDSRECKISSRAIAWGMEAVVKYLGIERVYIGIEANKPKAIEVLESQFKGDERVQIVRLKTLYPQGAEKSIIYATTGIVVEAGKLPADCGVIVMNVSSLGFLGGYLQDGIPMVNRRVTVDGDCVPHPQNLRVRIGTPIRTLLEQCGVTEGSYGKVLMGGPMMGLAVTDIDVPVVKTSNGITVLSSKAAKLPDTTACIRCGKCMSVCPVRLLPARLEKAYDKRDTDALARLHVELCINCGCCSYICPARRHLAQKNQLGKLLLKKRPREKKE